MATMNAIGNTIPSGNFTIGAGNILLPTTSSTVGQITLNGNRFLHGYGTNNVFLGTDAGNFTLTSTGCVCIGRDAGKTLNNTTNAISIGNLAASAPVSGAVSIGYQTGGQGISIGYQAGKAGCPNSVSIGYQAMSGSSLNYALGSVAIGYRALASSASSSFGNAYANIAIGYNVLVRLTEGAENVCMGNWWDGGAHQYAGYNYTGYESNNICISHQGVTGDNGKIRLGDQLAVNGAFIAGIYNYSGTIGTTGTAAVIIDSAGQLQSAHAFGANTNCKTVSLIKSRGTTSTPTTITANDALGIIDFRGHDGTAYIVGSQITSTNSGTVATNRIASDLKFYTHPDSTTSSTLRLTIDSIGQHTIAAPDSGTALTITNGGLTVTAGTITFTPLNAAGVVVNDSSGVITTVAVLPPSKGGMFGAPTTISADTYNLAVNTSYIVDNANLAVCQLPGTAPVGSIIEIIGKSAAFWQVDSTAAKNIYCEAGGTSGAGGKALSSQRYASMLIKCIAADADWVIISKTGTITLS